MFLSNLFFHKLYSIADWYGDIKMFDQCRKNLCSGNEKAAVANNPIV